MSNSTSPVLVRRSTLCDAKALDRLATLTGVETPRGRYLVAEVGGSIVAAVPLSSSGGTLADPDRSTAEIHTLLTRWAQNLTRPGFGSVDAKAA